MKLILASRSPRRTKLLNNLGLDFTVMTSSPLNEKRILAEGEGSLDERIKVLALKKGEVPSRENPGDIVLSADTEVVLDGEPLGKPRDVVHAREILTRLSGRAHHVYTGVAVQRAEDGFVRTGCEITRVTFNLLDSDTIDRYIAKAQPYDKAGSYAIQGIGALLVRKIEGDYSNVVGLPLGLTARMLTEAGVKVL